MDFIDLKYSQPKFYRFSETSVQIAKIASRNFQSQKNINLLDVFAGSGVVGLEFIQRYKKKISSCVFVELQKEFITHLEMNIKISRLTSKCQVFHSCFKDVDLKEKFDLILANPPYYELNKSRSSQNINRDICQRQHDFILDDFFNFLSRWLKKNGRVFFSYTSGIIHLIPSDLKVIEYPLRSNESVYELSLFN